MFIAFLGLLMTGSLLQLLCVLQRWLWTKLVMSAGSLAIYSSFASRLALLKEAQFSFRNSKLRDTAI